MPNSNYDVHNFCRLHLKETNFLRFQIVHAIELFIYCFEKINIIKINKNNNINI